MQILSPFPSQGPDDCVAVAACLHYRVTGTSSLLFPRRTNGNRYNGACPKATLTHTRAQTGLLPPVTPCCSLSGCSRQAAARRPRRRGRAAGHRGSQAPRPFRPHRPPAGPSGTAGPGARPNRAGPTLPQGGIYPGSRCRALSPLTATPVPARFSGLAEPHARQRRDETAGRGRERVCARWDGQDAPPCPGVTSPLTASPPGLPPCGCRRRARRASRRHDGGAGVLRAAPSPGTRSRARNVPPPGGGRAPALRLGIPRPAGRYGRGTPVRGSGGGWPGPRSRGAAGWLCWRRPPKSPGPAKAASAAAPHPEQPLTDKRVKFVPVLGGYECPGSVAGVLTSEMTCAKGRCRKAML